MTTEKLNPIHDRRAAVPNLSGTWPEITLTHKFGERDTPMVAELSPADVHYGHESARCNVLAVHVGPEGLELDLDLRHKSDLAQDLMRAGLWDITLHWGDVRMEDAQVCAVWQHRYGYVRVAITRSSDLLVVDHKHNLYFRPRGQMLDVFWDREVTDHLFLDPREK